MEIKVPRSEIEQKWQMLSDILPDQDLPQSSYPFMPKVAVFLSAVIVLFIITIGFVQAAKPGSLLYPVHTITQEVAKKITNTFIPENSSVATPPLPTTGVMKNNPTPTNKPTLTPSLHPTEKGAAQQVFEKEHTKVPPSINVLGTQIEEGYHTSTQTNHKNSQDSHASHDSYHEETNDNRGNGNNK